MINHVGAPVNLSASGVVANAQGSILGVFCASASTGTLKLWNNTAGSGAIIVNTFSLTAGTFYRIPASFAIGCYATIGGTADVTFFVG